MSNKVTLGGERLGSGKDMQVELQEFNRTTVDLGYTWRSTMSAGTLVPFMKEVALPGDTHEITLNTDVLTHPTIGPLFGSYKVQLDVFSVPIGLYQSEMIQNALNIGLNMEQVKMPIMKLNAYSNGLEQINPGSLLSHLDIRGLGECDDNTEMSREFNGVPMLAYWDIFKSYYANKQEDNAYYIKSILKEYKLGATGNSKIKFNTTNPNTFDFPTSSAISVTANKNENLDFELEIVLDSSYTIEDYEIAEIANRVKILMYNGATTQLPERSENINFYFDEVKTVRSATNAIKIFAKKFNNWNENTNQWIFKGSFQEKPSRDNDSEPTLKSFPLKNIDTMRSNIIKKAVEGSHYNIADKPNNNELLPYSDINDKIVLSDGDVIFGKEFGQELLAVKTYQSDLFNNWLDTEWLDGENGINEITKINVDEGLKINDLILHKKLFDMLNNIAISGGSYDNWLNAVYNQDRQRGIHSPLYHGGLIKELTFQEVISNSATEDQPLGTLAGRGALTGKHKGGFIKIKTDEPSFIIGIISLTPRIDYSQGNKWDTNLMTWDDFHKPQLDGIGFQDLITDQMDYRSTQILDQNKVVFRSAGKQPAWINYQTNVNVVKGNFAIETEQMFMTLNRRYESDITGIKDLTTYIDPVKYNHIFAYTRRDAQNFWAQIKVDMIARRKMSAKIIPNL